jgi:chemotaxis protein CheX
MSAAQKLNSQHPFLDRDVVMSIANSVAESLKVLADVTAEFEKPFSGSDWSSPTEFSVYLSLDSKPFLGKIQFHFDREVAKFVIEKITHSPCGNDTEEIFDGIGEISNIFYGSAKTKLNMLGFKLQMSLPVPSLTKNLPPAPSTHKCMIIPFKVNNALCYVEIIIN